MSDYTIGSVVLKSEIRVSEKLTPYFSITGGILGDKKVMYYGFHSFFWIAQDNGDTIKIVGSTYNDSESARHGWIDCFRLQGFTVIEEQYKSRG